MDFVKKMLKYVDGSRDCRETVAERSILTFGSLDFKYLFIVVHSNALAFVTRRLIG